MKNYVEIEELKFMDKEIIELSSLLKEVVDEGASIGFLPPLKLEDAVYYWKNVLNSTVKLFVARMDGQIVGSIQLFLESRQNGTHRAEIGKLMTHPQFRRSGIGRQLMQIAEKQAKLENRSLILLDTREGDPSNKLYQSLGFMEAGRIPLYAKSANGNLDTTVFYYKCI
ncbi:GNAT family N-acetyltransferase [Rummeliibacillus sp. JY-2-4R]